MNAAASRSRAPSCDVNHVIDRLYGKKDGDMKRVKEYGGMISMDAD